MRWEMEMEEVEAMLERIWDLHDRISDAIHSISRSHFLSSVKPATGVRGSDNVAYEAKAGFVYVKEFKGVSDGVDDAAAAVAEARRLNAIRTALENLEEQLEFFHTVQSHQRVERYAAIARLEQSRIVLAMRLADHHGNKYKVIEEALAFVGGVCDTGPFITPEALYEMSRSNAEDAAARQQGLGVVMRLLSGLSVATKSLGLEGFSGMLGNAALFAVSMLALLHLRQVAFKDHASERQKQAVYWGPRERKPPKFGNAGGQFITFDVFSARG